MNDLFKKLLILVWCLATSVSYGDDDLRKKPDVQSRLKADLGYLASPDREGRGPRTRGLLEAGDYIAGYTIGNDYGLHDFRDTDAGSMLRSVHINSASVASWPSTRASALNHQMPRVKRVSSTCMCIASPGITGRLKRALSIPTK